MAWQNSSIENILHIFHIFFIPFLFVYKNLYIISSSIEKFFMSTKTFILSKTEQNYIFHRILFSGHWSKKSFLYPFRSLSSKLFRKFKIHSLRSNCSKSSKGSRGARGANYFSLFIIIFIFIFHSRESVFTCKIFFFSLSFLFSFPFSWKCIYIHKTWG